MGVLIDLTGSKFGKLTALEYAGNQRWLCECDCGTVKKVLGAKLRTGKTVTCGCGASARARRNGRVGRCKTVKDETGSRYGMLIVLKEVSPRRNQAYWLCRCDCGNEKEVRGSSLRNGVVKSCGCMMGGRRLAPGEASLSALFQSYKIRAKKRELEFSLDRDTFRALTSSNCFYCGAPPSREMVASSNGSYWYNGIDRWDSDAGYTPDNSVSCCVRCNFAKRDTSGEEFIRWILVTSEYVKDSIRPATIMLEVATGQTV